MTNADTPTLAMTGLFDNPVNPFTSTPIYQPQAKDGKMYILYTDNWSPESNAGNVFTNTRWYSLSNQDIFDRSNWKEDEV